MRTSIAIFLIAGLAGGCSKNEDSEAATGAKTAEATETKTEARTFTVAEIIEGTDGPQLLGPFAEAKLGMTKAELEKAVPLFAEKGDYLSAQDFGITFYAYLDGEPERLESLRVTIPASEVEKLVAAWGDPVEYTDRDKPVKAWHEPETEVRAVLETTHDKPEERVLVIERYLPAAKILGEPGEPLGIEKKERPFLGATAKELEASYPEAFERDLETLTFMQWAPDEVGNHFKMELAQKDGTVNRVQFWLHHGGNEEVKKELFALLEKKFGEAKTVKNSFTGRESQELGDGDPSVKVRETKGAWVVEIRPKG